MRGRKRIPAELNKLHGNPSRRPPREEPQVKKSVGSPPQHLNAMEARLWIEYSEVGFWLTAVNRGVLEGYVSALATMIKLKRSVEETSPVIVAKVEKRKVKKVGADGKEFEEEVEVPVSFYQNPYLSIYNKARSDVLKFAAELGFTPVSISRVHQPEQDREPAKLVAFAGGKK